MLTIGQTFWNNSIVGIMGPGTIQFNSNVTLPSGSGSGGVFYPSPPVSVIANSILTLSGAITVANLTLINGNSVSLAGGDLSVNGIITFSSGYIYTGANKVVMPSSRTSVMQARHQAGLLVTCNLLLILPITQSHLL